MCARVLATARRELSFDVKPRRRERAIASTFISSLVPTLLDTVTLTLWAFNDRPQTFAVVIIMATSSLAAPNEAHSSPSTAAIRLCRRLAVDARAHDQGVSARLYCKVRRLYSLCSTSPADSSEPCRLSSPPPPPRAITTSSPSTRSRPSPSRRPTPYRSTLPTLPPRTPPPATSACRTPSRPAKATTTRRFAACGAAARPRPTSSSGCRARQARAQRGGGPRSRCARARSYSRSCRRRRTAGRPGRRRAQRGRRRRMEVRRRAQSSSSCSSSRRRSER